jgi:hypothetical protein
MSLVPRRLVQATLLLLVLVLALAHGGTARAEMRRVDVNLVLAIDSSSSVTMDDYYLQLEGYAAAFADPELWEAIAAGPHAAIAVALFEWSGSGQQVINFDWRVLESQADLRRFSEELALAPRLVLGGETAIGDALLFAAALLDDAPTDANRLVVDVSGDGVANRGTPPVVARAEVLARGATVNGLAVTSQDDDLEAYYAREVIGGSGSFVLSATDYVDFRGVIRRKLLREIGPVAALPR